jgi:hypothetical protein
MRRLFVVLTVAGAVSIALGAVALAGARGGDATGGASPGSPGLGPDDPVGTSVPTPSPVPEPPGQGGVTPVHLPRSVIAKYDPSWGLLGRVQSVDRQSAGPSDGAAGPLGSLLVVGDRALIADGGIDSASVTVRTATRIVALRDGVLVPAGFDEIHAGSIVAVNFIGPVAESYPVQAVAAQIVIVD